MVRLDGRLAQRLERPAYTPISARTLYKPVQLISNKSARLLAAFRLSLYALAPGSCTIRAQFQHLF
jgi:hypothetical protein